MQTLNFNGKTVFITGARRGIGRDIKMLLEELGASVIAPTRQELDLMDSESVTQYLLCNADLKIDIFIHCAGLNELAGIDDINQELMLRVFQTNYFSAVTLINKFVKNMRSNHYGRIIIISSLYALVTREHRIAYSSSKNALTGLVKTLALEEGCNNILVNAVAPGYVLTDMTKKNLSEKEIKNIEEQIPTGRFQSEREISNIVAFLTSDWNQSINGQLIAVDGGFTCR